MRRFLWLDFGVRAVGNRGIGRRERSVSRVIFGRLRSHLVFQRGRGVSRRELGDTAACATVFRILVRSVLRLVFCVVLAILILRVVLVVHFVLVHVFFPFGKVSRKQYAPKRAKLACTGLTNRMRRVILVLFVMTFDKGFLPCDF